MKTNARGTIAVRALAILAAAVVSATPVTTLWPSLPRRGSADTDTATVRGGFIDHCDFYLVIDHGEAYGHLHALCNPTPGNMATEVATSLDLNLCLGNFDNHLDWGSNGGAFASCQGCTSRRFETRYLDCSCGTIDLNEGIYFTESGAVGCYGHLGSANPVPY